MNSIKASYGIAYSRANKSKPLMDTLFIKKCSDNIEAIVCPEKKGRYFQNHCFSLRWLPDEFKIKYWKISGKNLGGESGATNFKFYALVMDDSTDATNWAPSAIFIRGIDDKENVTEEMDSLLPLKDTTISYDCIMQQTIY